MSMKRFGKAAYRIANEVLARNTVIRLWWPRIFPISHNLGAHVVLRNAGNAGRQTTFRLTKLIARNGRIFRPFSSILIEKNRLANNKNLLKHRKFHPVFAKRPAKYADFLARIRKLFGENARYNEDLRGAEMPRRIDEYEFGEFLGQGCNAAVYEAKLVGENGNSRGIGGGFNEVTEILRKNSRRPSSDMEFRMNRPKKSSASDNEASSDDEFEALTAQRSFYIDAVCGEDDSPITDDGKLAEWAEKEARSLGLLK
ncbi:unnamed protein product [Caenorhabditis angaria]|uniref:Uncharacterized protein n=1 Tax=Caenorhabditis angaria TaxID=860376 RepID=A0A9P1I910_9PELO|nr:unnamed protein product [Caenorhabditis angaria]